MGRRALSGEWQAPARSRAWEWEGVSPELVLVALVPREDARACEVAEGLLPWPLGLVRQESNAMRQRTTQPQTWTSAPEHPWLAPSCRSSLPIHPVTPSLSCLALSSPLSRTLPRHPLSYPSSPPSSSPGVAEFLLGQSLTKNDQSPKGKSRTTTGVRAPPGLARQVRWRVLQALGSVGAHSLAGSQLLCSCLVSGEDHYTSSGSSHPRDGPLLVVRCAQRAGSRARGLQRRLTGCRAWGWNTHDARSL